MANKEKAISAVPNANVSNLTEISVDKKNGNPTAKVTFKVPSNHTAKTNARRAESLAWSWWMTSAKKDKKTKKYTKLLQTNGKGLPSATSAEETFNRKKFYPLIQTVEEVKYKIHPRTKKYILDSKGKKIKISSKTVKKQGEKVQNIKFAIQERNTKGGGAWAVKKHTFLVPNKPKVEFDLKSGNILEIKLLSESTAVREKYDIKYKVSRKDTNTGSARYQKSKYVVALSADTGQELSGTTTQDEIVLRHDLNYQTLGVDQTVSVKVECYARGARGDSKKLSEIYTFEGPKRPIIDSVTATAGAAVPGNNSVTYLGLGQVLVGYHAFKGSNQNGNPFDYKYASTTVELWRRVFPESYDTPEKVISAAGVTWTKVAEDNGVYSSKNKSVETGGGCLGEPCSAVLAAMTQRTGGVHYGERVWYKIVATRQGISLDSAPMEAVDFYVPTPSMKNDKCEFLYMLNGVDGTSVDMQVGWRDNNSDDEMIDKYPDGTYTTEISWAQDPRAWHSNNEPESTEITWKNSSAEHAAAMAKGIEMGTTKNNGWSESGEFSIMDLEPGTKLYCKGRRHVKMDEIDEYGPYCDPDPIYQPFVVYKMAGSVTAVVPSYIVEGGPLFVSWYYDSDSEQKSWVVYAGQNQLPQTPVAPVSKDSGYSDTFSAVEIPYEVFQSRGIIDENTDTFYVAVGISVDDATNIRSDDTMDSSGNRAEHCVKIVKPPSGLPVLLEEMVVQPLRFLIFSSTIDAEATVTIRAALGIDDYYPDGLHEQPKNEFVWDGVISGSDWMASATAVDEFETYVHDELGISSPTYTRDLVSAKGEYEYAAIVTVPRTFELVDGGTYYVEFDLRNTEYQQLTMSPDESLYPEFTVEYSRKAPLPGINSTAVSRYFENGTPYVEIYIDPPENVDVQDVAYVYRMTPDGGELIAKDVPFGSMIVDYYPPFGKRPLTRYSIMTMTIDGCHEASEFRYYIPKAGIRFDWGAGDGANFLDLPYNTTLSDAYTKDAEIRSHMSGRKNAYFNDGVSRSGSLGAEEPITLDHIDPTQFEKLREMARYPGLVLVRAHDGTCYNANVNVSALPMNYNELTTQIQIQTEEVSLDDMYRIQQSDLDPIFEPEEEEIKDESEATGTEGEPGSTGSTGAVGD